MGAGPVVLVLVGMMIPISLVLLAVLVDLVTGVWVLYRLWHDAWSVPIQPGARPHSAFADRIHH